MLIQLTVRSKNFKAKTAATESFESTLMRDLKNNQNTSGLPALAGSAEFIYRNEAGRDDHFTVTESVAYVTSVSGGSGSPSTAGVAATNWTAVEYGDGIRHRTVLTRDSSLVKAVASVALCFGEKIYDFPEGQIGLVAGTIEFTISAPTAVNTPEVGIGHVLGAGAQTTIGAAGATMESILDGTATSAITTAGTVEAYVFAAQADLVAHDGSAAALDAFLNCAGNWAVTESVTFSDVTISLVWDYLGDV